MHRLSAALLRSSQSKGVSASALLSKQQQQSHNSSQNNVFSTTQPACTLVSAVTSDSRLFQQPVCSLPIGSNHTNQGALVTSFRNYSDGRRPGFFQNVLQNLKQEAEKNKDMQASFWRYIYSQLAKCTKSAYVVPRRYVLNSPLGPVFLLSDSNFLYR